MSGAGLEEAGLTLHSVHGRRAVGVRDLVEQLDEHVMLELDTYWAAVGGADTATVLRGLGGQARFVHVKDGPLDPAEPMTAVGAGRIDVVDALTASDAVAWHIVEIDRVEGDMRAAVVDSYRYLVEAGLPGPTGARKGPKEPFGAMTSASRASSRTVILVPCGPSGLRRM